MNQCLYAPGNKDEANVFSAVSASALSRVCMGDQGLRCLDCQGKFGRPVAELRCGTCGTLFKIKEILLSAHYPPEGVVFAEVELRALCFKLKEVAANLNQQLALGGVAPPEVDKGAGPQVREDILSTTPKSKPPVKGGIPPKGEASGSKPEGVKEEVDTIEEEPIAKKDKEHKKKKKVRGEERKERSPRSQEPKKSKRRSRSPRRSRSRRRREGSEENRREHHEGSETAEGARERKRGRSLTPIERRKASSPRRREAEGRRSPVRPRSPPGPPPPRPPERRWQGPIPSHQTRTQWDPYPKHPDAENKGKKKRRQQALFNEFKAWRKNKKRGYRF